MTDEAELRAMTIGELLDGLDYSDDATKPTLELALRNILVQASDFYDRYECASYLYWALSFAHTAVMASTTGELLANDIVLAAAAAADGVLEEQGEAQWDAATVAALTTIRDTHPDFVGGRRTQFNQARIKYENETRLD